MKPRHIKENSQLHMGRSGWWLWTSQRCDSWRGHSDTLLETCTSVHQRTGNRCHLSPSTQLRRGQRTQSILFSVLVLSFNIQSLALTAYNHSLQLVTTWKLHWRNVGDMLWSRALQKQILGELFTLISIVFPALLLPSFLFLKINVFFPCFMTRSFPFPWLEHNHVPRKHPPFCILN